MLYLQLFLEFFKTGLFAVGGGLATLPFLRAIAENYGWYTIADLMNMLAVSESTPGPIGINMATYVGFETVGVPGAFLATFSLVLPSVIVILMVAQVLDRFQESKWVNAVFGGLRPASAGLIAGAMFEVFLTSLFHPEAWGKSLGGLFNWPAIVIFVVLFILIRRFPKVHPVLFIISGAVFGVIFAF